MFHRLDELLEEGTVRSGGKQACKVLIQDSTHSLLVYIVVPEKLTRSVNIGGPKLVACVQRTQG